MVGIVLDRSLRSYSRLIPRSYRLRLYLWKTSHRSQLVQRRPGSPPETRQHVFGSPEAGNVFGDVRSLRTLRFAYRSHPCTRRMGWGAIMTQLPSGPKHRKHRKITQETMGPRCVKEHSPLQKMATYAFLTDLGDAPANFVDHIKRSVFEDAIQPSHLTSLFLQRFCANVRFIDQVPIRLPPPCSRFRDVGDNIWIYPS